jgi:hypothetical protein
MLESVKNEPVVLVPNRQAIEILEGALELARAGEVDGVVILLSHTDGSTSNRWGQGKGFWWVKMLGAAEVWKWRYSQTYQAKSGE